MALQISRQLPFSIWGLQADLKFYFQRERILPPLTQTTSLWFVEQSVIGNELTYSNEKMAYNKVSQSLTNAADCRAF